MTFPARGPCPPLGPPVGDGDPEETGAGCETVEDAVGGDADDEPPEPQAVNPPASTVMTRALSALPERTVEQRITTSLPNPDECRVPPPERVPEGRVAGGASGRRV
ncbi:hypothetical protein GCM10023195_85650 [Actinoallomurus liliacearum]|uniref:Uncharacterized protein n=1 Tax=Actinoallomurus liliacearum TaxID=1080073 RepID=A0ABP8U1P2_9ACTN